MLLNRGLHLARDVTHWSCNRTRPLPPDPLRSPPSCVSRFRRFSARSGQERIFTARYIVARERIDSTRLSLRLPRCRSSCRHFPPAYACPPRPRPSSRLRSTWASRRERWRTCDPPVPRWRGEGYSDSRGAMGLFFELTSSWRIWEGHNVITFDSGKNRGILMLLIHERWAIGKNCVLFTRIVYII